MNRKILVALAAAVCISGAYPDWTIGPFTRLTDANPVLKPEPASSFFCPVSEKAVNWEALYVYNPAAVVREGKVYLLYRAQGTVDGKFSNTSRIGLAESADGVHFTRLPGPVLYPDQDAMRRYEWPGGIEDPRIVEDAGVYYLTYSAYDGKIARLCVATSRDLVRWEKRGPAFGRAQAGRYLALWSKSGAIITEMRDGRQQAARINGKYWMYFGDSDIFIAWSDDLVNWTPLAADEPGIRITEFKNIPAGRLDRALAVRRRKFDSALVESGPPAILTDRGILLIYNSANRDLPDLPRRAYTAGQALFDPQNPARLLARTDDYFIKPEEQFEREGLVDNVVFLEGMVHFRGRWLVYYGGADSVVCVAATPTGKIE